MLPGFLCIGAQRSGTTWLDMKLRMHPDIYLPERRKEIHYFDEYHDRGIEWYEAFFKNAQRRTNFACIGEVTPKYLYHPEVPSRIHEVIPDVKFIVILRNPAERAYSQYQLRVRDRNERRSFQDFLSNDRDAFSKGLYSEQLRRYLALFPTDRFLILVFEKVMEDPTKALEQVAEFLNIDPLKFLAGNHVGKVNESYIPLHRRTRALTVKMAGYLRSRDMDWIVNIARRSGVERIFQKSRDSAQLDAVLRSQLLERYAQDILETERLLDLDLSHWLKK